MLNTLKATLREAQSSLTSPVLSKRAVLPHLYRTFTEPLL